MADTTRDAKLRLTLDSAEAVREMREVVRAGEEVERQEDRITTAVERSTKAREAQKGEAAKAAERQFERYGSDGLSKSEMRRQRANERANDRKHDTAQRALDDYRLNKHYAGLRQEKADKESADKEEKKRLAEIDRVHDEAQQRLADYKLAKHYKEQREGRAADDQRRQSAYTQSSRNRLHEMGLIDNRSEYEKKRQAEMDGGGLRAVAGQIPGLGGLAKAAGPVGVAMAAIFALAKGVEKTTEILNIQNNSQMTAAQKQNAISDTVTLGLSKVGRGLVEAIQGVEDRIRVAQIGLARFQSVNAVEAANYQQVIALQIPQMQARNRANVLGASFATQLDTSMDRSTMPGERAYHEEQQRFGARQSHDAATREAAIARENHRTSNEAVAQLEREYNDANRHAAGAVNRHNAAIEGENRTGRRNRGGRVEAHAEAAAALTEERQALERLEQAYRLQGQTGVAAAESQQRAREAYIGTLQAELSLHQQREQRQMSNAERLGSMSGLDRELGLSAIRMVEQEGIGNVHADIRQRAQQFDPDRYRQLSRELGENTAEYRGRQADANGFDRGRIGETRGEQNRLQQNIADQALEGQQQLANETARIMEQTLQRIMAVFRRQVDSVVAEFNNNQQSRNNQGGS